MYKSVITLVFVVVLVGGQVIKAGECYQSNAARNEQMSQEELVQRETMQNVAKEFNAFISEHEKSGMSRDQIPTALKEKYGVTVVRNVDEDELAQKLQNKSSEHWYLVYAAGGVVLFLAGALLGFYLVIRMANGVTASLGRHL